MPPSEVGMVTARIAARMEDTAGLAKMPPNIAPDSMFCPMYPAWLGSWPDPPPESRETLDVLGCASSLAAAKEEWRRTC